MGEMTVLLPTAAILFTLWVIGEYGLCRRAPVLDRPRQYALDRRDHLLAWGLTLVYAVVAFVGLGDTTAPESAVSIGEEESIVITLPEETELGRLRWYATLRTGSWTVESSADGETWESAAVLEQNYVSLFKWNDTTLETPVRARCLRLTAEGRVELGELALYDDAGELLGGVHSSAPALFDEQELVPERPSYRNSSYFDEIYHPRTALEGLRGESLYEITHPPLGKLILSLGILLFGMTPFGWRFMGTLLGALMLPVLYAFIKRLFGRRELAVCGTLIFAFDFMHYTQTRLATIDTYGVFFILLMYYFFYRFLTEREGRRKTGMLALSGLFFGMGAASKWTCLYAGAGLGLLWLLYWIDTRQIFRAAFWKNVGQCLLFFVLVPAAVYYLSYWPYGHAAGLRWPQMLFTGDYARLVWDNQVYMLHYHSTLVATHPYSSQWWQWLLDIRPILYYLEYFDDGTKSAIAAFTSPLLCWGGLLALLCTAGRALGGRSRKAGFIVLGYLAQLLPWVLVPRLTFAYHYFPSELFLVLALCLVFNALLERGHRAPVYAFTAASVGLFVLFYPVLSGVPIRQSVSTALLQWMSSWPI